MKVLMIKHPGGTFSPADEANLPYLNKFKNDGVYEIEFKLKGDGIRLKKMFVFFKFCFEYWRSDREFMNESAQFDEFRKNLTVMAGYYDEYFDLNGNVTLKARSLALDKMLDGERVACYEALVNAAVRNIFVKKDDAIFGKLMKFFD